MSWRRHGSARSGARSERTKLMLLSGVIPDVLSVNALEPPVAVAWRLR